MLPVTSTPSEAAPTRRARRALRAILLTALAPLMLLTPALAFAEGGSVRYSYEKVEVAGDQQWVLVPHAELALALNKKEASKGKVIEAFELLKKKKGTSYGDARIQIGGGKWPEKAEINITIDPKFATYAPIVMAEVVYTLTELGVPGVAFPGYSDGMLSRADIPFAVYTLTVPMWQALPPGNLSAAQVTLPDGKTLDVSEFYSRWNKKDPELQAALYKFLDSSNLTTSIFVMRKLPELKIPYVDQVVPLLASKNPMVRREALVVLASSRDEPKVSAAVAKQLDAESDATTALEMAKFIGASKDKKYAVLEPLWSLEKTTDDKVAAAAATALVKFKDDERVLPALYAQLHGKRAAVAQASMEALAAADADTLQIKALGDEKIPASLRARIAADLAEDKDVASRMEGLDYLANHAIEREASRAIALLAQAKDASSRARVEAFLSDKEAWRRRAAAQALAAQNESASLPAFAKAIKAHPDDLVLEEAGYTIMASQPTKSILDQTKSGDTIAKRLAYLALGERVRKEGPNKGVFDALKAGTQSSDAMIRGASARALGTFANKEAADVLATLKADKSEVVRRDVALAIGEFKGGELIEVLNAYLDDASPQVVAASIDSLGARGEGSAWDRIRAEASSKNPEVRAAALRGITRLVNRTDRAAVTDVISLLSGALNDKNTLIRKRALESLGTFKDENAVISIASQVGGDDLEVRTTAIRALGATRHPSATDIIVRSLDDPEYEVRRAATEALGEMGDKSAKPALEAQLKQEQDRELKELMSQTLKKIS